MIGWILLGILLLLLLLPVGASVIYNDAGAVVRIIAGPFKIKVFPRKKKEKPPKKSDNKAEEQAEEPPEPAPQQTPPQTLPREPGPEKPKKEKKKKEEAPKEEKGGSILDFLPFVKLAFSFLGDFKRVFHMDRLELKLIMAADDPCDLATNYGRAWAALGNLMPKLEKWFVIKKRKIDICCDFTAEQMKILARVDITLTLGRLLGLVFGYAFRALFIFLGILKIRKQRKKAVLKNESESSQHA